MSRSRFHIVIVFLALLATADENATLSLTCAISRRHQTATSQLLSWPADSYECDLYNARFYPYLHDTDFSNKSFYSKIDTLDQLLKKSTLIVKQTRKNNTLLYWKRGYQWISKNRLMLMRLLPFQEETWRPLTFVTYDRKKKKEQVLTRLNTLLATSPSQVCDWHLSPNKQWLLMHLRNETTLLHLNGTEYHACRDSTRWSTLYWLDDNRHYLEAYGGMTGAFLDYPELCVTNTSAQSTGRRFQNSKRNPLIHSDETLAFISTKHHLLTFNVPRQGGQYSIEKTAFLLLRDRIHLSRSSRSVPVPLPEAGLVTEAIFSPDASRIAYILLTEPDTKGKQSKSRTGTMNRNGKLALWICDWQRRKSHCIASLCAKFTASLENEFGVDDAHYPTQIQWLPDGKQISFACEDALWALRVVDQ